MQVLRVGSEPCARIVCEKLRVLLRKSFFHEIGEGRIRRKLDAFGWVREIEDAIQLRREVARLGTGLAQSLLQPPEGLLVAVQELDLELAEAARDSLALQYRDGVVHDLGPVGSLALAARPEPCDPHEFGVAQVRHEQVEKIGRWTGGRAYLLELGPIVAARDLELPDPGPVLDTVTERDPMASEA
jgi:hypothetical protein